MRRVALKVAPKVGHKHHSRALSGTFFFKTTGKVLEKGSSLDMGQPKRRRTGLERDKNDIGTGTYNHLRHRNASSGLSNVQT